MKDSYSRDIDYLRISITDLCNLRCRYCMPSDVKKFPMDEILTFEEIKEIVTVCASLGITKIKLTGGEPLVRRGFSDLTKSLLSIPGIEDVTLTTNGVLLKDYLPTLKSIGIKNINISLDTLNAKTFEAISGFDEFDRVFDSIFTAVKLGMNIKINTVLQEGLNDCELFDLVELAKDNKIHVRFIELMPIGSGKSFKYISNKDILEKIKARYTVCKPVNFTGNGPAEYISIDGFLGYIGFISPMHNSFCSSCNRIRLTSVGALKPCLCYGNTVDLRSILRSNEDPGTKNALLKETIEKAIWGKPKAHDFHHKDKVTEVLPMTEIGG